MNIILKITPCDSNIKNIQKPINAQKSGDIAFRYFPKLDLVVPLTFTIFLSANSLNGTRIHQACANCQIMNIMIKLNDKRFRTLSPYSVNSNV